MPVVDPTTRNVQVQATLANPQGKLHPGMFVKREGHIGPKPLGDYTADLRG